MQVSGLLNSIVDNCKSMKFMKKTRVLFVCMGNIRQALFLFKINMLGFLQNSSKIPPKPTS